MSYLAIFLIIKILHLSMFIFKMVVVVSLMLALFIGLLFMFGMLEKFQILIDLIDKVKEIVNYVAQKIK